MATCGMFLAASIAVAQQPGQGRGRGGFGGPGGGMFGGNGALFLVQREPVQKDLGLKEDQVAKIEKMGTEIREEMRSAFTGGGQFNPADFQNLSEADRAKRREEMQARTAETRKKVDEKFKPMLSEILTEEQEKRLDQIALQVEGPPALLEADMSKKLNLSKDQTDKLASINKEYTDKQRELMPQGFGRGGQGGGGGAGGGQEVFTKMRELRETRDKDMVAVLNADQKAKYEEAKGKAFDVASVRGGPGGGGPGGAGGRSGGGAGGRPRNTNNN